MIALAVTGGALAVAAGLAATAAAARRETRGACAREGQVLRLPGGDLHVRVDGDETAPPLVLLHGFGGSIRWWQHVVPLLRRRHRVIRIDLPGHGGSEKHAGDYSTVALARQVGRALDRLSVNRAVVVGQSMGGLVAILLADIRPALVSRLILLDSPLEYRFQRLNAVARVAFMPLLGPVLRATANRRTLAQGLSVVFADGFPVPAELVEDSQRMTWRSFKQTDDGQDRFLKGMPPMRERVARLGIPVRVIWGTRDRLWPLAAASSYRGLQNVTVYELEGAGHSPMIEMPQRTAELIEAFAGKDGAARGVPARVAPGEAVA